MVVLALLGWLIHGPKWPKYGNERFITSRTTRRGRAKLRLSRGFPCCLAYDVIPANRSINWLAKNDVLP